MKKSRVLQIGILTILFGFLCFMGNNTTVKAEWDKNGLGGPGGGLNSGCAGKDSCWSSVGDRSAIDGIRVTVVYADGTRVPNTWSVDYINSTNQISHLRGDIKSVLRFASTKKSRYEIVNGGGSVNWNKAGSGNYQVLYLGFDDYLNKVGNVHDIIGSYFLGLDEASMLQILENSGYTVDQYQADCQDSSTETWLAVEPLTYIYDMKDKVGYVGTATELESLILERKYSEYSLGYTFLRNTLPYGLFITGNKGAVNGKVIGFTPVNRPSSTSDFVSKEELLSTKGYSVLALWTKDLLGEDVCTNKPADVCPPITSPRDFSSLKDPKNPDQNCCQYYEDLYKNNSVMKNQFYNNHPECKKNKVCDPTIKVGDCNANTQGTYEDPGKTESSWNTCVKGNNQYLYKRIGSDDGFNCHVYCRESFYTDFPGSPGIVDAGRHFLWEQILANGYKYCRNDIDFDEWKKYFDKADATVASAYKTWMEQQALSDSYSNHKNTPSENNCNCTTSTTTYIDPITGEERIQETRSCSNKNITFSQGKAPDGYTATFSSYCDNKTPTAPTPKQAEESYKNAVKKRQELIDLLSNCTNGWDTEYSINPYITLNYDYFGLKSYTLVKAVENSKYEKLYTSVDTGTVSRTSHSKSISYNNCDAGKNGSCPTGTKSVTGNSKVEKTRYKYLEYKLPEGTNRYIVKPSGFSQSFRPVDSNYIDIGYANLPVHYTTAPGAYKISLTYNNIGENGRFDQYLSSKTEEYVCPYQVTNKPFCSPCDPQPGCCADWDTNTCGPLPSYCGNNPTNPPDPSNPPDPTNPGNPTNPVNPGGNGNTVTGLNWIYRPIKLTSATTAFPWYDGSGRTPGDNWNSTYLVKTYITNNRNVAGDEVYKLKPLYDITLTAKDIKAIRDYNKKTTYADFNLTCKAGTGRRCTSDVLYASDKPFRKLFDQSNSTCFNSGRSDKFYTCADKPIQD